MTHKAPLSTGFSNLEYWSELPRPPLGDLRHPGMEPVSLVSYFGGRVLYHGTTWEAHADTAYTIYIHLYASGLIPERIHTFITLPPTLDESLGIIREMPNSYL